jgi:Family of unknown function (DUF6527)
MNANKIIAFENAIVILDGLASSAKELSGDQTPMPDGQGTVASRFNYAIFKFGGNVSEMLATDPSASFGAAAGTNENSAPIAASAGIGATGSKNAETDLPTRAVFSAMAPSQVGDFYIDQKNSRISIWLPGDTMPADLPIRIKDQADTNPKAWLWDGDLEKPTLSPSIFVNPPHGWHGWLVKGVLTLSGPGTAQPAHQNAPAATPAPGQAVKIVDQVQPEPHKPAKFWMAGMDRNQ